MYKLFEEFLNRSFTTHLFRQKIQILYSRLFFKLRSDSACHHVFYFTYKPTSPHTNSQVHLPTHNSTFQITIQHNNSQINITGFDVTNCAAQLLYGPVLVNNLKSKYYFPRLTLERNSNQIASSKNEKVGITFLLNPYQ